MKPFVFIFSVYLLAISVMPCSDVHNECLKSSATIGQTHHHEPGEKDFCSPFCNCNCCSSSTTFSGNGYNQKQDLPEIYQSGKVSPADFFFVSDYNGNIWQPPRMFA